MPPDPLRDKAGTAGLNTCYLFNSSFAVRLQRTGHLPAASLYGQLEVLTDRLEELESEPEQKDTRIKEFEGDRTSARRVVTDVVADLSEYRFDGDRFDFESYVESAESARRASPKLREIFIEGITVHGSDRLQSLRKAVFADELHPYRAIHQRRPGGVRSPAN